MGTLRQGCTSSFWNLDEQSRDPAGTVWWLMELLAKVLRGLAPVQSPSS